MHNYNDDSFFLVFFIEIPYEMYSYLYLSILYKWTLNSFAYWFHHYYQQPFPFYLLLNVICLMWMKIKKFYKISPAHILTPRNIFSSWEAAAIFNGKSASIWPDVFNLLSFLYYYYFFFCCVVIQYVKRNAKIIF